MARLISVKQSILHMFILALLSLVSNDVIGATEHEKRSLCPKDLSPMINNPPNNHMEKEHPFFQQWQTMVRNFAPILHEGGTPSVFISHAWHLTGDGRPVDPHATREEALYYDYVDLYLARVLKDAGFDVHYDKDITNSQGIIDEGAASFMTRKVKEDDVIIGVCTPLYYTRSTSDGTGVQIEVDLIKKRLSKSATIGFYIPLLVHASDEGYNSSELLVGQEHERMNMKQVQHLDWRNKKTFISNMWRLFHRLWKNVKLKWEDNLAYDPQTSPLNQRYIKALGDLLQIKDCYDNNGQPINSGITNGLEREYSNLRILTTIWDGIDANTVATSIKKEIEDNQKLLHTSKDQHIVAFLGNTGTGKSTLINFLAGKELQADEYGQGYELAYPDDSTSMKVGSGADSETVYPQSIPIYIEGKPLLFFDLPGFNDTSGSIRDLVNSAFIRQILMEASSVRFVFVAGQDEITVHRSKIVKRLFNGVKVAFQSPAIIENNSMLIVTKSNFQDCSTAINFWLKKMRSAHGTELQDQLSAWNEKGRLFHMPHSSFSNVEDQQRNIREMLTGIINMVPARQEDMQGFNISVFFPPEINMPLQKMFLHVIDEQSKKDIKLDRLEKFTEHMTMKEECLDWIASENLWKKFWQELWQEMDESLSQEMVLLKEVCQVPYKDARNTFEFNYESKRKKYIQCFTINKPKAEQLVQKGYDEETSWLISKKLIHEYEEKFCEQLVQLFPKQTGQGHDDVFMRFLKGKLIYKPNSGNDEGKVEIPFISLSNPLEGTFDLSNCGDAGKYISISTGYRKGKISANARKLEIWITPQFLIQSAIPGTAEHYARLMNKWKSPIGLIWKLGDWDDGEAKFDFLITRQFEEISSKNLYDWWRECNVTRDARIASGGAHARFIIDFNKF